MNRAGEKDERAGYLREGNRAGYPREQKEETGEGMKEK